MASATPQPLPWRRRLETQVIVGITLLVAFSLTAILVATTRTLTARSLERASTDLETARTVFNRLTDDRSAFAAAQAVLVVHIAKSQHRLFGGTENFLVTREYSRLATHEEKLGLLECLFAVSAADESISSVEDHEVRRIAAELGLGHADFIAARTDFRQYLAVLKTPPPGA